MITSVALLPSLDARRHHERWLARADEWFLWRVPRSALRMPLPSVWGLEPVRRLAASLEVNRRVGVPVPASAFFSYDQSAWYRRWVTESAEIDDRAQAGSIELFPELLGKQSPVALLRREPAIDDAGDAPDQARALPQMIHELELLIAAISREQEWGRFSVEWASCRTLLDICTEAVRLERSTVFYPEFPQSSRSTTIALSTIAVRGLHRIRAVRVLDSGKHAEVTMINGDVFVVRAEDAFQDRRRVRITRASVGRRRAVVVLTDDRGLKLQLTPHRILHLSAPAFIDD